MQNKGDFVPFNMKALIYQIVTNFKNTRIFCPIVQNFCVDGTHNVKFWYRYFTISGAVTRHCCFVEIVHCST